MSEELKPCPFCGKNKLTVSRGLSNYPFLFIKCGNPDCRAIVSFDNDACNGTPKLAIKHWNKRSKPAES